MTMLNVADNRERVRNRNNSSIYKLSDDKFSKMLWVRN